MVESERADCVIIGVRIYYNNKVKSIMSMFKNISNTVYLSIILAISPMSSAGPIPGLDTNIDQASYDLGEVVAFSEMVGVGVKKLALSPAMSPADMDKMENDIRRIAQAFGVEVYREPDMIITDLFPAEITRGKHVMLLHKGTILDEYLALKKKKRALLDSGKYSGENRKDIAREFGRLLSYPENNVEQRLK